ncbi:methyltransferase domain-containing protein [Kitasatospora viridis]|uniref:Protein arginine N-methyltransferase 1 n=1 Tax=Kitasatospora viridis TaxID=281105 RepID=A0A561UPD2_9ACTN|nr:methyltransferase domain-containing protein [Kitasatospora viridis]TWG01209.1 protein arginine N-methyltransferase 1 [Kitasatospora viridis]
MEYEPEQPWLPASEQLLDWSDDFHRLMLGDQLRMDAYRAAVAESVRPGDTVLDLGTGTGILARWALEAGAARVYGIDLNKSILDTAVERLTVLGLVDRFVPLHGLSFDLELPERVDLVISEILGNLADNENAPAILGDARQRFLRPGGRMLPSRVESYLVPVAAERAHRRLREGSPADAGGAEAFAALLGRRGSRSAFDLYYDTILPLSGYLAAPRILRAFDLTAAPEPSDYRVPLVYACRRPGRFTGFKGYFVATLADTVALDISGDEIGRRTTSDSWKHCFLPIETPVQVEPGDRIVVTFSRLGAGSEHTFRQGYRWEGEVISARGGRTVASFSQGTA